MKTQQSNLKTLCKLAAPNKNLPILRTILFDGNTARATNLETTLVITGAWQFDKPKLVPVERLKIALGMAKTFSCAGTVFNGVDLADTSVDFDATDFPIIPDEIFTPLNILRPLSDTLRQVCPAMANKDIRYYINGLYISPEGHAVATNGHRLHILKNAFSAPPQAATIGREIFCFVKAPTGISLSDHYARMEFDGGYGIGKLLDGTFPDFNRVTPAIEGRTCIPFNSAEIDSVKRIGMAQKATNHINVIILESGKLSTSDRQASLPFPVASLPSTEYRFNHVYLYDALLAAGHGDIWIADNNSSMLIHDGDFQAVVMPMRI